MNVGDYGVYKTSKMHKDWKPVRVKIMSEPDKRGRVLVRVTSNRHPRYQHGQHITTTVNCITITTKEN